jgi:hypothetical protein
LSLKGRLDVVLASAPPFGTDALIPIAAKGKRRGLELDLHLLFSQPPAEGACGDPGVPPQPH